MIIIAQVLYILSLNQDSFLLIYPISILLILCGFVYLYQIKNHLFNKLTLHGVEHILVIMLSISFLLVSLGPPTMADALDYHFGIPVYLLNNREWPITSIWLAGSLGGIGEIYNTLGLTLHTDNLGSLIQATSLIAFCHFLSKNYDFKKSSFLSLFILSSPILIFLVTGPKAQLFPQTLTATSLYLTVSNKKIDSKTFAIICILVMGAAQQKLSFILTGGVIGIWALCKAFPQSKLILLYGFLTFIFFFLPRGLWNIQQLTEFSFIGFFTPLPTEFTDSLRAFRGSRLWFPFNIFFPEDMNNIHGLLGFQILLLLLIKKTNPKFRETFSLIIIASILIYFLGQAEVRSYYEMLLWTAVALSFLTDQEFRFNNSNRFLVAQGSVVLAIALFGVFTLTPGSLSTKWREEIMNRSAFQYSAMEWSNKNLPKNAVVISLLRSVSLLETDFISGDWLNYDTDRTKYYEMIKNKKVNFIISKSPLSVDFPLFRCVGKKFAGPKSFPHAIRSPFNTAPSYNVAIYHFNSKLLPECI